MKAHVFCLCLGILSVLLSSCIKPPASTTKSTSQAGTDVSAVLSTDSNTALANGIENIILRVFVQDSNLNPVDNANVSMASTGGNNRISISSGTTDGNGMFVSSVASTEAQTKTVTALVNDTVTSNTLSVAFVAGEPNSALSEFYASPSSVVADGVALSTIYLKLLDAYHNAVADAPIVLSSNNGNSLFVIDSSYAAAVLDSNATSCSAYTDANGAFAVNLMSFDIGVVLVNLDINQSTFSATTAVDFTQAPASGVPDVLLSSFVASPNLQIASGYDNALLSLYVLDATGVAVTNESVTFSSNSNLILFSDTSCATNSSGFCSVSARSLYPVVATVTAHFATDDNRSLSAQVTFIADTPVVAHSTFTANNNVVIADGVATSTLTFFAADVSGYPVVNTAVAITATGLNNIINHSTGTTDQNGLFHTTIASTGLGNKTISAWFASNQYLNTVVNFVPGPPDLLYSTLQATSNSAIADGNSGIALILSLYDAENHAISTAKQVTFSSSNGNDTFTPASGYTSNGVLQTLLTSTEAGSRNIIATFGSLQITKTVSFVSNNIPSASLSSFTVSPNVLIANNQSEALLVVDVVDAFGNPIVGAPVGISANPNNGVTLLADSNTTNSFGEFSATLYGSVIGTKTLVATVGSNTTLLDTPAVSFVAGSATYLSFYVQPATTQAGNIITPGVQVRVLDAYGNLANDSRVVTLSINTNTANLTGTLSRSATNGVAVFNDLSIANAASGYYLIANANGLSAASSGNFTITAQPPPVLAFVVQPNNTLSNSNISPSVVVQLRDYAGNPLTNNNITVTLSLNSNTLGTALTSQSNAVFGALQIAAAGNSYRLSASAEGYTSAISQYFNVTAGPINANMVSFSATPNSVIANSTSTSVLRLLLRDTAGNAVANQAIVFSSSDGNDVIGSVNYSNQANGIYTASLSSLVVGSKTLSAQVAGNTFTTTITLIAGVADANHSLITISPNSLTTDNPATVTVVLRDSFNHVVSDMSIILSSDGMSNSFYPSSGTTDSNGTFVSTMRSNMIAHKTVMALFDTGHVTSTVDFLVGSPNTTNTSFTISPNIVVADGSAITNLIVIVEDVGGNPVANQNVVITVFGNNDTLNANSTMTDANGRYVATLASTTAEEKSLQASFGGISPLNRTMTFVAGPAASLLFTTQPAAVVVAGVVLNPNIQVEAIDAYNNVVGNFNSLVTMSLLPSATLFGNTSSNANNAVATFAGLQVHNANTTYTLHATSGFITGNSNTFAVIASSPNATNSNFYASPSTLVADGSTSTLLTLNIVDVYGNPTSNQNGQITVISGGNTTLLQNSNITDANGNITATLVSTTEQTVTLQAVFAGSAILNTNVVFVAGNANATNSNFYTSSNSLTADGASAATLTLVVLDTYGNVVKNQAVSITSSGTSNNLVCNNNITNASGIVTATLKSTKAETKVVQAHFGSDLSVVLQQNIVYTAGDANAANSNFYASLSTLPADGNSTTTLTLVLVDTYNNPIAGEPIAFSPINSNNLFSSDTCTTNTNGSCFVTLASTVFGTHAITAGFSTGSPNALTTNIVFESSLDWSLASFAVSKKSIVSDCNNANNFIALTLSLKDVGQNPYVGQTAFFSTNDVNSTLMPTTSTTDANGSITTYLHACTHGLINVTATVNSNTLNANVVFKSSHDVAPFLPGAPSIIMNNVASVDASDINGDGIADLAMITTDEISIFTSIPNTADGVFWFADNAALLSTPASIAWGHNAIYENIYVALTYSDSNNLNIVGVNSYGHLAVNPSVYDLGFSSVFVKSQPTRSGGLDNIFVIDQTDGLVGVLVGSNNGNFQNVVTYNVGVSPQYLALGDFNGDGNQDIVVSNSGDNTVSILLNQGDDTFVLNANYSTGNQPMGVVAYDFNQDGNVDIAVVNYLDNTLSILLNQGNAIFLDNNPNTYATGSNPFDLVSGDFNSDGNQDIVVTNYITSDIGLFLGNGAGGFAPMVSFASTGFQPTHIAASDLNGDGFLDVAVSNATSGEISIILGNGNGLFSQANIAYTSTNTSIEGIASGLFNNDTYLDMVAISDMGLSILLNDGTGAFPNNGYFYMFGIAFNAAVVADFNQDGNQDIAAVGVLNTNVVVLLGNGDGTFQAANYYNIGSNINCWSCSYIATGELNGDAYPDLVISNPNDGTISVLYNNGDGTFPQTNTNYTISPNGINTGAYPYTGVAVASLTGNHSYQDIVVSNSVDNGITLFYNNHDGTGFSSTVVAYGTASTLLVAIADINADGLLDITVNRSNGVDVLLNIGNANNPSFAASSSYTNLHTCSIQGFELADINQDGLPDLVWGDNCGVNNGSGSDIGINLGNGDGTFGSAFFYTANRGHGYGGGLRGLHIADFNGDTMPDIAVGVQGGGGYVPVLLNTP